MIVAIVFWPTDWNAVASGAFTSMWLYLTIPVTTSDTATYSSAQIASDRKIPSGRSRWGFFASSALVATMSKPMNAKNTSAAPLKIPADPERTGSGPDVLKQRGAGAAARRRLRARSAG